MKLDQPRLILFVIILPACVIVGSLGGALLWRSLSVPLPPLDDTGDTSGAGPAPIPLP